MSRFGSSFVVFWAMLTPLACAVSLAEEEGQVATNGGSSSYDAGGASGFAGSSGQGWASTGGSAGIPSTGGIGGFAIGGTGGFPGCAPGTVQNLGTCELCGTEVRTCDAFGNWGPPECTAKGVCIPGAQEQQGCGSCGVSTRTCQANCTWSNFGNCTSEGACSPGSTKQGNCDACSHQVCNNSCAWSGCQLKAGNQCDWESGNNFQCCAPGKWQFCSSACQWNPCQTCSGCGC